MRNLFNSVPRVAPRYNKFDLSRPNFFTAEYGTLYPCLLLEVNAGEVFKDYSEDMVRTMPLRAPAFIESDCSIHYFFVPFRLCYKDWSHFIVRGEDGNTDYDKPYLTPKMFATDVRAPFTLFSHGSLMDFLNFPTLDTNVTALTFPTNSQAKVDLMPFNAYSLIYNEFYRDENLVPEVFLFDQSGYIQNFDDWNDYKQSVLEDYYNVVPPIPEDVGDELVMLTFPMFLRQRSWRKDYFTSALPFVQKGVPISLAGQIVGQDGVNGLVGKFVSGIPVTTGNTYFVGAYPYSVTGNPPDEYGANRVQLGLFQGTSYFDTQEQSNHRHSPLSWSNVSSPLSVVTPIEGLQSSVMTISDLRVGLALQQWFELNARTGSDRYFEYLLGHFGVRDRDARLQRPEYLGGFTHSIQISEVEQNSSTDSVTPQGNLAGKGLGYAANAPVRYRFPEPGYLMALFSIRPRAVYWQGMPRMFQRWDAFDYYDPLFDHLSEQAIYTSELVYDWSFAPRSGNDSVFGYTPRFSEYRTALPEMHGEFRSSLRYWVSPRKLQSPELNRDFIEVNGYSQELYEAFAYRAGAYAPSPHFYVYMRHHISMLRPMSKYATPKL